MTDPPAVLGVALCQRLAATGLYFPPFMVVMVPLSVYVWFIVRNRENVLTTYRVSQTGIVIENSRYGVFTLNWDEVTRATYRRLGVVGETITLDAAQLAKPLVIMIVHRTRGSIAKFVTAQTLIQRAMGHRWVERWF